MNLMKNKFLTYIEFVNEIKKNEFNDIYDLIHKQPDVDIIKYIFEPLNISKDEYMSKYFNNNNDIDYLANKIQNLIYNHNKNKKDMLLRYIDKIKNK